MSTRSVVKVCKWNFGGRVPRENDEVATSSETSPLRIYQICQTYSESFDSAICLYRLATDDTSRVVEYGAATEIAARRVVIGMKAEE